MAADNGLMRPLRSENLKPRPSTQAVWEPRTPVEQPQEPPVIPEPEIAPEPVVWEMPAPQPEPALEPDPVPVPEPAPVQEPEPAPEAEPDPIPEPEEEPAAEDEEPAFAPYTESIFTFAPACAAQPEPPAQEPEPEEEPWQPAIKEEEEAEEEPFDLDAVIASILAQDDEDDEDEDHPAAQDALPTEEMPEPAAVPLYEMPKAKPVRKGWIWLIAAALIVAAAGYAAKRFGWLN